MQEIELGFDRELKEISLNHDTNDKKDDIFLNLNDNSSKYNNDFKNQSQSPNLVIPANKPNIISQKLYKPVESQLEAVGDEHKYQINIFIIFSIQWVFATMLIMGQPFIFKPPIFMCDDPEKPGQQMECSALEGGCKDQILKSDLPNSVVMEFNLYCDREWMIYSCSCLFFAGTCVFSLVFAQYAEIWGRKIALFISYLIGVFCIFITTFTGNVFWFGLFYTFSGGGFYAYTIITYVHISETTSAKYMQYSTVGLLLTWALGEMLLPLANYFVTDWRFFLRYVIAVPGFVALMFFNWVYESPRYIFIFDLCLIYHIDFWY